MADSLMNSSFSPSIFPSTAYVMIDFNCSIQQDQISRQPLHLDCSVNPIISGNLGPFGTGPQPTRKKTSWCAFFPFSIILPFSKKKKKKKRFVRGSHQSWKYNESFLNRRKDRGCFSQNWSGHRLNNFKPQGTGLNPRTFLFFFLIQPDNNQSKLFRTSIWILILLDRSKITSSIATL